MDTLLAKVRVNRGDAVHIGASFNGGKEFYPVCGSGGSSNMHNFRRAVGRPVSLTAEITCSKCRRKAESQKAVRRASEK